MNSRARLAFVAVSVSLCFSGCLSHPAKIRDMKACVALGDASKLVQLDNDIDGRDKILMLLERARARQLVGDFAASSEDYAAAMAEVERHENAAMVRAGAVASGAGAMIVNDLTIPYRGETYELIMMYQFDAFNRIALRDFNNVGPDVFNMRERLQKELDKRGAEEPDNYLPVGAGAARGNNASVAAAVQSQMMNLRVFSGKISDSFQNPYSYYFAGMYYESIGDLSNAALFYRRARALMPDTDAVRAITDYDDARMREKGAAWQSPAQSGNAASATRAPQYEHSGDVVFFLEDNYTLEKHAFELDIPWIFGGGNFTMISVSIPTYNGPVLPPAQMWAYAGNDALARFAPVCNFQGMAAKALEERLPGIMTRQVVRTAAKATAVYAVGKGKDDENTWASLLAGILVSASEQADLRSWLMMPAYGHIARVPMPAGTHKIRVGNAPAGIFSGEINLGVVAGKTTVVHCMYVPGRITVSATTLP